MSLIGSVSSHFIQPLMAIHSISDRKPDQQSKQHKSNHEPEPFQRTLEEAISEADKMAKECCKGYRQQVQVKTYLSELQTFRVQHGITNKTYSSYEAAMAYANSNNSPGIRTRV